MFAGALVCLLTLDHAVDLLPMKEIMEILSQEMLKFTAMAGVVKKSSFMSTLNTEADPDLILTAVLETTENSMSSRNNMVAVKVLLNTLVVSLQEATHLLVQWFPCNKCQCNSNK